MVELPVSAPRETTAVNGVHFPAFHHDGGVSLACSGGPSAIDSIITYVCFPGQQFFFIINTGDAVVLPNDNRGALANTHFRSVSTTI